MTTQKKFSNVHTFIFEKDSFNFSYVDKSGSADVDVRYIDFPKKSSVSIERNQWLRNVGVLWTVLGLVQVAMAVYSGNFALSKMFWIVLGLGCLAWSEYSKVIYSVFKTNNGNVFVIQDKQHDQIIAEINQNKKNQILRWYGDIDFDNEVNNEINKFKWMFDENVISKDELEQNIQKIRLHQFQQSTQQNTLLN